MKTSDKKMSVDLTPNENLMIAIEKLLLLLLIGHKTPSIFTMFDLLKWLDPGNYRKSRYFYLSLMTSSGLTKQIGI